MQDDEEFNNHNLIELASVSYARPIFATLLTWREGLNGRFE